MESPKLPDANELPLATVVITMNIKTGEMRVTGNVIKDSNLTIRMLIEAGHFIMNNEAQILPAAGAEAPPLSVQ